MACPICPGCGAALLVDSPINIIANWPQVLAANGFRLVAMANGWEQLELLNSVCIDLVDATTADAVYVGDLITAAIACPRCDTTVSELLVNCD